MKPDENNSDPDDGLIKAMRGPDGEMRTSWGLRRVNAIRGRDD